MAHGETVDNNRGGLDLQPKDSAPAAAPMWIERRAEPRIAVNTPARLFYGQGFTLWFDCLIKDRSRSGAKVHVPALFQLPPRVVLLDYGEGVAYSAQRRWRKGDLAGLWLEVRHDLQNLKDPGLKGVREAWLALGPGLGSSAGAP